MRFIKKTQTKIVSAIGAIRSFLWKKMLPTMPSMKSTIISTPFCSPPGTPAVARFAARPNNNTKTMTEADCPHHRVDVDGPEAHLACLLA